jgi:hypothetical protein
MRETQIHGPASGPAIHRNYSSYYEDMGEEALEEKDPCSGFGAAQSNSTAQFFGSSGSTSIQS